MASLLGKQAIVVGAGMGGLAAAGALADYFEYVIVLERDRLLSEVAHRAGTPQARHVHVLLAGGQRAFESLFPGVTEELANAGAVPMRMAVDTRSELAGYDPFPQRDLGWDNYSMSRSLAEYVVRKKLAKRANVELRQHCRVAAIAATSANGAAVSGVRLAGHNGEGEFLAADLVVDASGSGALSLAVLQSTGHPVPAETRIGVDLAYATTVFSIPDEAPSDWRGVYTFPDPPLSSRGGLMMPIEGDRWILSLGGAHGDVPPGDLTGFLAFAERLRTATIHRAIQRAKPVAEVARFAFPESIRRHFEQMVSFPRGLIALGDALCRFNPIYGQGMSVAAQEACILRDLLATRAAARDPLEGLPQAFFAAIQELIDTAWATAAVQDFAYPQTRGERPPDIENTLKLALALNRAAARDANVHKLAVEVRQLLKPRSAYRDPAFVAQVFASMAEL
jgi:2-polyprenyl-6-methoxyphenol hydroxylase-like FAD-dependent oxidoreductase